MDSLKAASHVPKLGGKGKFKPAHMVRIQLCPLPRTPTPKALNISNSTKAIKVKEESPFKTCETQIILRHFT